MSEPSRTRKLKMRMRLNVLCLAGALLSCGFCLLPWTISHAHTEKSANIDIQLTATEFALQTSWADYFHLILSGLGGWPQLVLGAQIFLVGLALSFASPLGGFVQLAGLGLFRGSVNDYLGYHNGMAVSSISTSVNFTYYLSIVAAFVVILSLFFQFSPDFHWSTTKLKDRLFVYSRFHPQASPRN